MRSRSVILVFILLFAVSSVSAQRSDVSIVIGEDFFDAFLESLFKNFDAPKFSVGAIAEENTELRRRGGVSASTIAENAVCDQSVKIIRENGGVRTAVRFRDGKIYVPLAFTGEYALPLIGCVEYSGWAESLVDLEFERSAQRLTARIRVTNVNLDGSNGLGGSTIARLLQSSLDKRMNPVEVFRLDQLAFAFPIRDAGRMRMRAIDARPVVTNSNLVLIVTLEMDKER